MRPGNYAQIRKYDIANGEGIRTTLFVTGCSHRCRGCFNPDYFDFKAGAPWTEKVHEKLVAYLADPNVVGLTLLGGEPLQNLWLTDVLRKIRAHQSDGVADKTIWIYSGYTFEQILEHPGRCELIALCDVLVDGLFVEELKDVRLKFRGSSNQRLIAIQPSLQAGAAVLYEPR